MNIYQSVETYNLASERRRSLRQSANERAMAEGRLKSDILPTTFTINIQNAMPKKVDICV